MQGALGIFFALLLGVSGEVAQAQSSTQPNPYSSWGYFGPKGDFQITKLFCSIREGRFISYLQFKTQIVTDHPVLTAELANYSINYDGSKRYISGILFTKIQYSAAKIMGDTGDPSDLLGRFVLTRLDAQYNGRWSYWFQRTATDTVKATFNCAYNDSAIDRRRRN
jgi:hypothetical protein